ncbi:MIP/aquaporin family protein [Secundilactobacillus kimchicus]|uniref:MIP/aquaporin family protein n=1 Tax=Secundilactobacillus kimchicus TaxID=528209 RepID=UPI0024A835DC|nr:MIP/aquaporin family protein [Secundilactobacillus kimchicus]
MKTYVAEFLGTFMVVATGTATMALTNADPLTIGLAFGGTYAVAYYAFNGLTLGEFNPAVSLALAINHQLKWAEMIGHVLAQILGAILASGFVYLSAINLGTTGSNIGQTTSNLTDPMILLVEGLLTFFVVLVYLRVNPTETSGAALINGLVIVALSVAAYSLTGPALNPARAIGPAVYVGGKALFQLGDYVLAGLIGSVCAAIIHRLLKTDHSSQKTD